MSRKKVLELEVSYKVMGVATHAEWVEWCESEDGGSLKVPSAYRNPDSWVNMGNLYYKISVD